MMDPRTSSAPPEAAGLRPGRDGVADAADAARPGTGAGRESGSAYVIALLALVVLTIFGLSLALLTQSEVLIGANERLISRVFYATDSGISVSTARMIVTQDYDAHIYTIDDAVGGLNLGLRHEIDVSPVVRLQAETCDLCEKNGEGHQGEKRLVKANHAVTATGQRLGGLDPDNPVPLAQRVVAAMIEVQPTEDTTDAYLPFYEDPDSVLKVRY